MKRIFFSVILMLCCPLLLHTQTGPIVSLADASAATYRRNSTTQLTAFQNRQPIRPTLWYQPDTAMLSPALTDTISAPTSYTMMMVYQTLRPAEPQQLWRISRTDSIFYAITTHGINTEHTGASNCIISTHTVPTIYTLQHTLRPDTAYHGTYQLQ